MSIRRTFREITEEKVALFEKVNEQLHSFYREIGLISKKKPSEPLNKFKLGFINQTLNKANDLLGEEYRPFPDFMTFDIEASIPTASDVVMMLDQYSESLKKFKADHYDVYNHGWHKPKAELEENDENNGDETGDEEEEYDEENGDDADEDEDDE